MIPLLPPKTNEALALASSPTAGAKACVASGHYTAEVSDSRVWFVAFGTKGKRWAWHCEATPEGWEVTYSPSP